jgi:hypothetical protein
VSRKPQYQYGNSYSNGEKYSILFDSQFTPTWGKNWLDNQLSKLFQGFNPTDNSRTLYLGWQYNQPGETTWLVSLKSNEHSNISNKFNLSQQHNYAPKLQTASVGKPIPENTAMPTAKQNNPDSNIDASEVKALAVFGQTQTISDAQAARRKKFPWIAAQLDILNKEIAHRQHGAGQFMGGVLEFVLGGVPGMVFGVDNMATGIKQMVTNIPEANTATKVTAVVGDSTGLFNPDNAENISLAINIAATGFGGGLTQKSAQILSGLDLAKTGIAP